MGKLDDIEKKNPFKVPEGYFENLPDRIQKRLHEDKPEKLVLPVNGFMRWAAVILFFLVAGFAIVYMVNKEQQNTNGNLAADNNAIENYIDEEALINVISEDSTLNIASFSNQENSSEDDTAEYLADKMDYGSLLAEL